jgi:DNA-binding Lrp family transcriptional regulator
MNVLPIKVQETLSKLKEEHKHYVEIKTIGGLFCAFESTGLYDSESKKTKKITRYLGVIREDGTFVPSKRKVAQGSYSKKATQPEDLVIIDNNEEKLLMELSMNGRATYEFLGKQIGVSKNTAYHKVKALEKRFGIRYLAEIDTKKLGYLEFLMLVKFEDRIPTYAEVNEAIKGEPRIQLALMLNGGEYDLLLYILAESTYEIYVMNVKFLRETLLIGYPAKWYVTPFYHSGGYVPARAEFIDSLKIDKLEPEIMPDTVGRTLKKKQLLKREFAVLKELNENGSIDFADIDKKYGFDRGRSQYSYHKLVESGMIKRITITLERLPLKYTAVLITKILYFKKFSAHQSKFLQTLIDYTDMPINKYSFIGDIGMPFGSVMFLPVFSETNMEEAYAELSGVQGMSLKYSIITKVLLGSMCYRLFDNKHSRQTELLAQKPWKKSFSSKK